jgi:hypothetical protein
MTESFPLKWPFGQQRTESWRRKDAAFATSQGRARDELIKELRMMGATNVVITSNVATYERGGQTIMYANQKAANDDPGVSVFYSWKGDQYALACDKWKTVVDNLQALNKTVNAIRGIERWGSGDMMKAAFAGFKELPQQKPKRPWWEVLGIAKTNDEEIIKIAFRRKAFELHPDRGGTTEAMQELNEAYKEALNQ